MEAVPPALADATVLTPSGEVVRFGAFWTDQDAVLVLVRHFG